MGFKKAYATYKKMSDDKDLDKIVQTVVRTFGEECEQIQTQLDIQTELHNFMSSIIPMSKKVREDGGFKLNEVLPKEMESQIPSLRPISELQKQALSCRDYIDVGVYHAKGNLFESLGNILEDSNFDMYQDSMVDALTQTSVADRGYDNFGYLDSWLDGLDNKKFEVFSDEMERSDGMSFDAYGQQVLDFYGGLPITCYDVMYNKLNEAYAGMGNKISNRDIFVTPEFDTNYAVHKEWERGQEDIFGKYAKLYSKDLNQNARDQLGRLMSDLGHGNDWSSYAKDHNVPVLTEENEFKVIVARNERIANGMAVPDWVRERDEQGGYDYGEFE